MAKLPVVSGADVIRVLRKLGYDVDQQRGSHIVLRKPHPPHHRLSVPNHKELRVGTLRRLIRDAGLTVEEFANLLRD